MKKIVFFDTTLRDGQQSPGAWMSISDNVRYAQGAKKLGVDYLEAGFPSASWAEFERVQTIIAEIVDATSPVIVGLTQIRPHLVEKTIASLLPAAPYKKGRMHIYIPIDPKLAAVSIWTAHPKEFCEELYVSCKQATDAWLSVEFSLEGYSRMGENFDLGTELICAAIEWWATMINCPDTIGMGHRSQGEAYFVQHMRTHAARISELYPHKEIFRSTHNHNDIWTAVENSLYAVTQWPATQIECTMNGVGERAGNASLEQLAIQIYLYGQQMGITHGLHMEYLQELSDLIAEKMLPRQPHRPVTWVNAARHTSWGHVNALLKDPSVYQPFDPKIVWKPGISLLFWLSSWGNHVKEIVEWAWYRCDKEKAAPCAQYLKDTYADRYKWISDEEVVAWFLAFVAPVQIREFNYSKLQGKTSFSYVGRCFDHEDETVVVETADSALSVFHGILDHAFPGRNVVNYASKADTSSIHAHSVTDVTISDGVHLFHGQGIDADIEIAALQALAAAYNNAYIGLYIKQ